MTFHLPRYRYLPERPVALLSTVFAAVLLMSTGTAHAQDEDQQSLKLGDADLYPSVRLSYVSNDNVYLTSDDVESATGTRLQPELLFRADKRNLAFKIDYQGDYGIYSNDDLDYDDHALVLSTDAEFGVRRRGNASLEFFRSHYDLGTEQTSGVGKALGEEARYQDVKMNASFTYGAKDAQGNVEAGLFYRDRNFDALYDGTVDLTTDDDHTLVRPYGQFSYRLSADTRALFELRYGQYDFPVDRRDRNQITLLTGFSINENRKFSGHAEFGLTRADYYNNVNRKDRTLFVTEGALIYRPTSFAVFKLGFSRELRNTDDVQNTVQDVIDELRLTWNHEWSSRVSSRSNLGWRRVSRDCPRATSNTVAAGVELGVKVRRWVEVGAGVSGQSKESDVCAGEPAADDDHDRILGSVFVRLTL